MPKTHAQRELKVKANRSESNIQFHAPQSRFSFGEAGTPSSSSLRPQSTKNRPTARFTNKFNEKADSDRHSPVAPNKNEASAEKIEITEAECYSELGFSYPEWKKWGILTVIFLVQVSCDSCDLVSAAID